MKTEIFMVTHLKDIEFAKYSLMSIEKFARAFHSVHVLVPNRDVAAFISLDINLTNTRRFVHGFDEVDGKGMLHHMAMEVCADMWCPTADNILHLDADCIFTETVTPDDYIIDGRPVLYREKFSEFQAHPHRKLWQQAVFNATGIMPEYETMVRHPSVHPREIYPRVRTAIESHTGMRYLDYIMSCKNEYPQTFAEYPTIGAVAIRDIPEYYNFVDHSDGGKDYIYTPGRDKMKSFWSHGGIKPYEQEIRNILQ